MPDSNGEVRAPITETAQEREDRESTERVDATVTAWKERERLEMIEIIKDEMRFQGTDNPWDVSDQVEALGMEWEPGQKPGESPGQKPGESPERKQSQG